MAGKARTLLLLKASMADCVLSYVHQFSSTLVVFDGFRLGTILDGFLFDFPKRFCKETMNVEFPLRHPTRWDMTFGLRVFVIFYMLFFNFF